MSKKKNTLNGTLRHHSKMDPEMKKECFICGDKKNLQKHHIIKVADICTMLLNLPREIHRQVVLTQVYLPMIYACDEDYKMIHTLMGDYDNAIEVTQHENERIHDMLDLIDPEQYFGTPLQDGYEKLVDRLHTTVETNLEYFTKEDMIQDGQLE